MMYAPTKSQAVVMRWAASPEGPWSNAEAVLDMKLPASRSTYCCQGTSKGKDNNGCANANDDCPRWSCADGQFLECGTGTSDPSGQPRTFPYAPYLLPPRRPPAPAAPPRAKTRKACESALPPRPGG